MKLPLYTVTPGLEHFPHSERFAIYRSTHKRLMREDAEYRKHRNAFVVVIICLAICPVGVLTTNGTVLLAIILALGTVPAIIWLAFRQQKFMNQRIGEALQNLS